MTFWQLFLFYATQLQLLPLWSSWVACMAQLSERWHNVANGIMVNLIPSGRKGTTVSPIQIFWNILSVPFQLALIFIIRFDVKTSVKIIHNLTPPPSLSSNRPARMDFKWPKWQFLVAECNVCYVINLLMSFVLTIFYLFVYLFIYLLESFWGFSNIITFIVYKMHQKTPLVMCPQITADFKWSTI